ncbi:ATP-binding protein, partial [Microbacteriaceae bacterium K1510]|nr:ATP-binding protein [Microbacteriaceae bacterium K1510]
IDSHVRQAIFNLRSLPEEGSAFSARLDKWLTQWSALSGIDVIHDLAIAEGFFSPAEEVQLFGVIQEAFTNIRKHANASHSSIRLVTGERKQWELQISDDGCGITEPETASKRYGLSMMRERAAQLGATLTIRTGEAGGTEITLNHPKK